MRIVIALFLLVGCLLVVGCSDGNPEYAPGVYTCPHCGGDGVIMTPVSTGKTTMMITNPCNTCMGTGYLDEEAYNLYKAQNPPTAWYWWILAPVLLIAGCLLLIVLMFVFFAKILDPLLDWMNDKGWM